MRQQLILLLMLGLPRILCAETISLNFYQAPLALVLQTLAQQQQLNIVIEQALNQPVTIRLNKLNWQRALDIICRQHHLHYQLDGKLLTIQTVNPLPEQGKLNILTLAINHNDAAELATMLEQQRGHFLSEQAKIIIDKQNNRLVIHEREKNHRLIKDLITEWDRPKQQVQISAHIVTINSDSLKELGAKWQTRQQAGTGTGLEQLTITGQSNRVGFNLAHINHQLLNLELSALEAENRLEIIANPNLLTTHLQTASIKQGSEIPYEVSQGDSNKTTIQFKEAVLGLQVTPRILNNQQLELTLQITQNTPGQIIRRGDGSEHLAIDTQEIKTQIRVKNGDTVILGGILQRHKTDHQQAVPLLGQIPLLGALFRHQTNKQQQRELVIFITPKIIV